MGRIAATGGAAQEHIGIATQVLFGFVVGKPPAEVAVQGHQVEVRLQGVMVGGHQLDHGRMPVVPGAAGQGLALVIPLPHPIAFPISHPPADLAIEARGAKHQINGAGEEAFAHHGQLPQAVGVAGAKRAAGVVGKGCLQALGGDPANGEIEVEFVEPRVNGQLVELEAAQGAAKGGGQQLFNPQDHGLGVGGGNA